MNKKEAYKQVNEKFLADKRQEEGVKELRGGVLYEVIASGESDKQPGPRSIVTCHYKGSTINGKAANKREQSSLLELPSGSRLDEGKVFDETFSTGCPAAFRVNDLISGFQIALVNMHVGDHWRVFIPSEMGYGKHGAGSDIPGNSTLIFEIQLIAIA